MTEDREELIEITAQALKAMSVGELARTVRRTVSLCIDDPIRPLAIQQAVAEELTNQLELRRQNICDLAINLSYKMALPYDDALEARAIWGLIETKQLLGTIAEKALLDKFYELVEKENVKSYLENMEIRWKPRSSSGQTTR